MLRCHADNADSADGADGADSVDGADSADVEIHMKIDWLGVFRGVCSFSFYIWSCDEWASVRRPEATCPSSLLRSSHLFLHSTECTSDRFIQDPYLLTQSGTSGTMTKCLIHDTHAVCTVSPLVGMKDPVLNFATNLEGAPLSNPISY